MRHNPKNFVLCLGLFLLFVAAGVTIIELYPKTCENQIYADNAVQVKLLNATYQNTWNVTIEYNQTIYLLSDITTIENWNLQFDPCWITVPEFKLITDISDHCATYLWPIIVLCFVVAFLVGFRFLLLGYIGTCWLEKECTLDDEEHNLC